MDEVLQQLNLTFDKDDSSSAFNIVMSNLNEKIASVKADFQKYFDVGSRGISLLD